MTEVYKKKPIPKAIRMKVWETNIGDKIIGSCYCCEREVKIDNFDCAHIVAEKNGGVMELHNLKVTCKPCNTSCGILNLNEFKQSMNNKQVIIQEHKLENTYDVKYAMINTYSYIERNHNMLCNKIASDSILWNKWYEQYNIIKNKQNLANTQYCKIYIIEDKETVNISVRYINQHIII